MSYSIQVLKREKLIIERLVEQWGEKFTQKDKEFQEDRLKDVNESIELLTKSKEQ